MARPDIVAVLKWLSLELRELDVGEAVPALPSPPSAIDFLREYVGPNKPVLVRGAISHWPALSRWSNAYLGEAVKGPVTVAFTPSGRADAVTALPSGAGSGQPQNSPGEEEECFALPYQCRMAMGPFLALLCSRQAPAAPPAGADAGGPPAGLDLSALVPYMQYQNSSLLTEAPALAADVETHLGWASQAFGARPEAVNLWVGDERSKTSVHKDPYENLYAVVAGEKVFTLLPPSDVYRMALRRYTVAEYRPCPSGGGLRLQRAHPPQSLLWSSWQPEQVSAAAGAGSGSGGGSAGAPGLLAAPELPRPLRVVVRAGEVLYLPAMWWHQVEQRPDAEGRTIAVNYWYDMRFDVKQAGLKAVERLALAAGLNQAPPEEE